MSGGLDLSGPLLLLCGGFFVILLLVGSLWRLTVNGNNSRQLIPVRRQRWTSSPYVGGRRAYSKGHASSSPQAFLLDPTCSPKRGESPRGRSPPLAPQSWPKSELFPSGWEQMALPPPLPDFFLDERRPTAPVPVQAARSMSVDSGVVQQARPSPSSRSVDSVNSGAAEFSFGRALTAEAALIAECSPHFQFGLTMESTSSFDPGELAEDTAQRWKSWRGSGDEILGVDDAAMRRRENLSWRLWWRAQQHSFNQSTRNRTVDSVDAEAGGQGRCDVSLQTAVLSKRTVSTATADGQPQALASSWSDCDDHVLIAVPKSKMLAVQKLLNES